MNPKPQTLNLEPSSRSLPVVIRIGTLVKVLFKMEDEDDESKTTEVRSVSNRFLVNSS